MTSFESELHMFEERGFMLEQQVKTYSEGIGPVVPTGEVSNHDLVEAVHAKQTEIEDLHVVCIDEREALEAQPVRYKMAGGNVTTGFAAAELADWTLYTDHQRAADPAVRVDAVASYLIKAGEKLGGHIDNHATDEKSNCGAADGYPAIISVIAEHGKDEQFVAQMQDALGTHFDQNVWRSVVDRAAERAGSPELKMWTGYIIINTVKKYDGVVEVLNGDHEKPAEDPTNSRLNHWSEGVGISTVPGQSNDRDRGGIPFFQVDAPKIIETCQKMSNDETEFARLLHAAVGYQFATRFKLTRDQRNVII